MEMNPIVMDNDSGYPESTLDSSSESAKPKSPCNFYMNEDALLEEPSKPFSSARKSDGWKTDSFDSVISASETENETSKTKFDESDTSLVIPYITPIVVDTRNFAIKMKKTPKKTALSNVTNTKNDDHDWHQVTSKNVSNDKENRCPILTPKKYKNNLTSDVSPDIFQDEDLPAPLPVQIKKSPVCERYFNKKDAKLLKNIQSSLSGVCPPPSLTVFQSNVADMLNKITANSHLFWTEMKTENSECAESKSLLISGTYSNSFGWPRVMEPRHHGLLYNRGKISEEIEYFCNKYGERYIGSETQSTCTVFESNNGSPQKRKTLKPRWAVKSPGRRLSHLARRRITFSSSNLQVSNGSSLVGSRARQILVDAKKLSQLKRKSPRKSPRKTPLKSPFKLKTKSPSSSAKKKLAMRFRRMTGEFDSAAAPSTSADHSGGVKRPLFQSPDKSSNSSMSSVEKKSLKRELFPTVSWGSSNSSSSESFTKKRKRLDFEDQSSSSQSSKIFKSASFDTKALTSTSSTSTLNRTMSENSQSAEELKQRCQVKLRMSIYESLRSHNVLPSHPQFKAFAGVLATVIRRLLMCPTMGAMRPEDRISRLARVHSYAVVKGKSVDEIIDEYNKTKAKCQKPKGYVTIEEYQKSRSNISVESISDNASSTRVLQTLSGSAENSQKSKVGSSGNSRIDRIRKVISFDGEN